MRLSYSTLAMLDMHGDQTAHVILCAWYQEVGILWEPEHLQVHYHAAHDYLIMQGSRRAVVAPYRWSVIPQPALTLEHPIIPDNSWFQKGR